MASTYGYQKQIPVFLPTYARFQRGQVMNQIMSRLGQKSVLRLLDQLDHTELNSFPGFEGQNPTCEVLARHIYRALGATVADGPVRLSRVRVSETPGTGAIYSE